MLPILPAVLAPIVIAPTLGVMPAMIAPSQPSVDYMKTVKCAYNTAASGWASVGRAPRGTTYVVFTMRTGVPGDWSSAEVTSTSKARQWRVDTGPSTSFVNWVTFYSDEGWIESHMVNTRCEGTPAEWPS